MRSVRDHRGTRHKMVDPFQLDRIGEGFHVWLRSARMPLGTSVRRTNFRSRRVSPEPAGKSSRLTVNLLLYETCAGRNVCGLHILTHMISRCNIQGMGQRWPDNSVAANT